MEYICSIQFESNLNALQNQFDLQSIFKAIHMHRNIVIQIPTAKLCNASYICGISNIIRKTWNVRFPNRLATIEINKICGNQKDPIPLHQTYINYMVKQSVLFFDAFVSETFSWYNCFTPTPHEIISLIICGGDRSLPKFTST